MMDNIKFVDLAILQRIKAQEAAELRALETQIRQLDSVFATLLGLALAISAIILWVG